MSYIKTSLLTAFILSCPYVVFAETVTMTTYYPSPSGNYSNMNVTGSVIFTSGGKSHFVGMEGTSLYFSPGTSAEEDLGMVVSNAGNIGIKKQPGAFALDVNGTIQTLDISMKGGDINTNGGDINAAGGNISAVNGNIQTTGAGNIQTMGAGNIISNSALQGGTLEVTTGLAELKKGAEVTGKLNVTENTTTGTLNVTGIGEAMIVDHNARVKGALTVKEAVTADAFEHHSDERLKEDITPITGAIAKVQAIDGVYFKYKGKEDQRVGFIAQNVEKVLPEVVSTDSDGMKSVDYSSLVPLLVQAIKEQQVMIEKLQGKDKDR
jgi:hypothetical protein